MQKNSELCPILGLKIKKMADFCGFAGVFLWRGVFFLFFYGGAGVFCTRG